MLIKITPLILFIICNYTFSQERIKINIHIPSKANNYLYINNQNDSVLLDKNGYCKAEMNALDNFYYHLWFKDINSDNEVFENFISSEQENLTLIIFPNMEINIRERGNTYVIQDENDINKYYTEDRIYKNLMYEVSRDISLNNYMDTIIFFINKRIDLLNKINIQTKFQKEYKTLYNSVLTDKYQFWYFYARNNFKNLIIDSIQYNNVINNLKNEFENYLNSSDFINASLISLKIDIDLIDYIYYKDYYKKLFTHYCNYPDLNIRNQLLINYSSYYNNYFLSLGNKYFVYADSCISILKSLDNIDKDLFEELKNNFLYHEKWRKGNVFNDFELYNTMGNIVKLSDYKDKYILLHFWSTVCAPCIRDIPLINNLYDNFSDTLVVLNIAWDDKDRLVNFLKNRTLKGTNCYTNRISRKPFSIFMIELPGYVFLEPQNIIFDTYNNISDIDNILMNQKIK